jgi:hypothetical protein
VSTCFNQVVRGRSGTRSKLPNQNLSGMVDAAGRLPVSSNRDLSKRADGMYARHSTGVVQGLR